MVGAHSRGVLVGLALCTAISRLWLVVQRGAGKGIQLSLTDTSLMTWQAAWMREALWRACGGQWGQGGQAGGDWGVQVAFQSIVVGPGAGRIVPSSVWRIQMNTPI
jgi:hypothetical protein